MSVTPDVASLTLLQADLLRAAFGADETAVAAWRRWRDAIDWEAHLDHDAFRLLPRTYRNLRRQGGDDPLLPRLKGITLQAWYANQRRARQFHPTLQTLAAAGVELLIVPPTAVLLHDATAVLRRHAPLACAVRGSQAEAAIRCLWRQGWRAGVRLPRWSLAGYVLAAERLLWQDGDGQTLDLQWQCDPSDRRGRFPAEVWERASRARVASEPVLMLGGADTVHDLCRRPVVGNAFGQIADLLLCVDAMKAAPDWQRFFARARQAPVAPEWQGILRDLQVAAAQDAAGVGQPRVAAARAAAAAGHGDRHDARTHRCARVEISPSLGRALLLCPRIAPASGLPAGALAPAVARTPSAAPLAGLALRVARCAPVPLRRRAQSTRTARATRNRRRAERSHVAATT